MAVNLQTGGTWVVQEATPGTVQQVLQDRQTGEPLAVSRYFGKTTWHVLSGATGPMVDGLRGALQDGYSVACRDNAMKTLVLKSDRGVAQSYYIYDTEGQAILDAGVGTQFGMGGEWRDTTSELIGAPDGMLVPIYVTEPDRTRFGDGPYPAVIWVHGGPWIYNDRRRWLLWSQMIAEEGWAAVVVDYRGTFGYGGVFVRASHGALHDGIMEDVRSAADTLEEAGVVDAAHIAWWGESYGGFATLLAASMDPPWIRCGVAQASVVHFGFLGTRVHGTEVRVPMLFLHGGLDARAPRSGCAELAGGDGACWGRGRACRLRHRGTCVHTSRRY
ncbi:MAG: prolyl oligopeptidase family serine peptidase [Alphaproteobacteria bacterium]|nr:prolyl oligopeptidase family serine peptidase [Alphaproteobacteria bacterium]